jgi:predicted transcriptional regulator
VIQPGQISAVRKRLGISQSELARRSGVSQSLIAKIERGHLDPAFSKAQAISAALEAIRPANDQRSAFEVMNPDLVVLGPGDPVEVAIASMIRLRISQIPVMDGETVQGTLTKTSLMDFVVRTRNDSEALRTPINLLMDDPLPQVSPTTQEDELLSLLKTFPAVLVRDKVRIQGIITRLDILSRWNHRPKQKKEMKRESQHLPREVYGNGA